MPAAQYLFHRTPVKTWWYMLQSDLQVCGALVPAESCTAQLCWAQLAPWPWLHLHLHPKLRCRSGVGALERFLPINESTSQRAEVLLPGVSAIPRGKAICCAVCSACALTNPPKPVFDEWRSSYKAYLFSGGAGKVFRGWEGGWQCREGDRRPNANEGKVDLVHISLASFGVQ